MTPIITQWSVFTGSPCSGKSSVIRELEKRGYPVRGENSRAYFDAELAKGRTLEEICADQLALQKMFLETGLEKDSSLAPAQPYMLDRSPVDAVAHYFLYGFDATEALEKARTYRYAAVFYFEQLPSYSQDAVRVEDEALAKKLDKCFRRAYHELGYEPVTVPLMLINERADFISRYLAALGIYSA